MQEKCAFWIVFFLVQYFRNATKQSCGCRDLQDGCTPREPREAAQSKIKTRFSLLPYSFPAISYIHAPRSYKRLTNSLAAVALLLLHPITQLQTQQNTMFTFRVSPRITKRTNDLSNPLPICRAPVSCVPVFNSCLCDGFTRRKHRSASN